MQQWARLLTPANIAAYAVAINFVAFAAFGLDKMLAESNGRRISEANLLTLAFLGGTPAAYAGRQLFRHKTRKQPFSAELHTVALIQVGAIALFLAWRVWR